MKKGNVYLVRIDAGDGRELELCGEYEKDHAIGAHIFSTGLIYHDQVKQADLQPATAEQFGVRPARQ